MHVDILYAMARQMAKLAGADIDDLEAPNPGQVMRYLRRAHKTKFSSWMDIGPDITPERPWVPPKKWKGYAS